MIVVLVGADELAMRRRMSELRELADGGSGMLETNLTIVDGREAKPHDILAPATAMPFLAPHRMVIVENLIDRYESRPGERRARGTEAFAPLLAGLADGLPDSTVLVFTGGAKGRAGNPLVKALGEIPGVTVEEYPELRGEPLLRFIREEAGARGMRLDSAGVTTLAALYGGDTLSLANELDKLSLYTMGRPVTKADVDAVCSTDRTSKIWDYTDAAIDGDVLKASDSLAALIREGEEPEGILAMLFGSFRTLATVADMLAEGASPEEIGRAIRQQYPNLRDRAINRARRLGPAGIRQAYELMVAMDRDNKAGLTRSDVGIELLTARLCALGAASRATPARSG